MVRGNIKIIVKRWARQFPGARRPRFIDVAKSETFSFPVSRPRGERGEGNGGREVRKNFPLFAFPVANFVSLFFTRAHAQACYFSLRQGVFHSPYCNRGSLPFEKIHPFFRRTAKLIVYAGTFHKIPPKTCRVRSCTLRASRIGHGVKSQFNATCKDGGILRRNVTERSTISLSSNSESIWNRPSSSDRRARRSFHVTELNETSIIKWDRSRVMQDDSRLYYREILSRNTPQVFQRVRIIYKEGIKSDSRD